MMGFRMYQPWKRYKSSKTLRSLKIIVDYAVWDHWMYKYPNKIGDLICKGSKADPEPI